MKKKNERSFPILFAIVMFAIIGSSGYIFKYNKEFKKLEGLKKRRQVQRHLDYKIRMLQGACFVANTSAFIISDLLSEAMNQRNFNSIGSFKLLKQQLEKWGFKRYAATDLHKAKKGAILVFGNHVGVYLGNDTFIDPVPGWYKQCGIQKDEQTYAQLVGKNHACSKKNPYTALNPNTPGLEKVATGFTMLETRVSCVTTHRLKQGKVYKKYPLHAFYQYD